MEIEKKFASIAGFLIGGRDGDKGIAGVPVTAQFTPGDESLQGRARSLNASFLIVLAGPEGDHYREARRYLEEAEGAEAGFLIKGAALIRDEVAERYQCDPGFRSDFDALHARIVEGETGSAAETRDAIWRLFFPEGVMEGGRDACRIALREKRGLRISNVNGSPIQDPGREILFTSNVLVTVPPPGEEAALRELDRETLDAVRAAAAEPQRYWYDHPIPVGVEPGENELLHCLEHLAGALRAEEAAGEKKRKSNIECVLSVSVTHRGLHGAIRPWLRSEVARAGAVEGINIHVFTEHDTGLLLDEIIIPAGRRWIGDFDEASLREVFGVDGEYGRHYSFLKSIARFWHVFVSKQIRATFKIDLDQAFPQEELVRETGTTAFGHLRTPLWGARGTDSRGEGVYLGMIAGALVNRRDIGESLFTPDVRYPEGSPSADEVVFRSAVPQALSTEAEMMERYGEGGERDGVTGALQRVHVTGGTSGILVEALKRYRPFTPTCIGRAEDQAYLLSALRCPEGEDMLRYVHQPGLIMRHDAELFAAAAAAAKQGKFLGDVLRVLLFTCYARALPWPVEMTKDAIDPFTGCFISRIPATIALLRFSLRAAGIFEDDGEAGTRFFSEGVRRLSGILEGLSSGRNPVESLYRREREAWDAYHEILDRAEMKIAQGDPFAASLARRARQLTASLRVDGEGPSRRRT
ncbi:MAG: hypothetical protein JW838_03080 [Spirochaetes bacterium]|nr:hypothetical protein [Spirochaetota bacterium]